MTDEEKREIKVKLFSALIAAEEDFALLREKSLSLNDGLHFLADELEAAFRMEPSEVEEKIGQEMGSMWDEAESILDYAGICKLHEEFEIARKRLFNLRQRKDQLSPKI